MHDQLIKALEEVKSLELAEKHLNRTEKRLREATAELRRLDRIVETEHQQYEELEKAGLRKLFRNILGKGEEKLQQEKQDYLEAVLEYNQQRKEVELLEFERNVLLEKVGRGKQIREEYQRQFDYHSEQIARMDTPEGQEMRKIDHQLEYEYKELKEVTEAIQTGQETRRTVRTILDHLEKSGWWAEDRKWKNMLKKVGKKLEHIDKARKLLPPSQ